MTTTTPALATPARLLATAGQPRSLRRLASIASLALAASALAQQPTGGQVVAGQATINQNGNLTHITASNGAIINWQSFSIGQGQTVQFLQPSSSSRVLNRVTSADPSVIAGQLKSNGIVYISNAAGVYFARGALVNVGGIYAAAGSISDAAFQAGANSFQNVRGVVENHGTINSAAVALVGQRVANYGVINAPRGMVTLAAGNDVLVGEQNGQIFARVSTTPGTSPGGTGVTQAGQINAQGGRVALGAGDLYAMAIDHPGSTRAASITLQGGKGAPNAPSVVSVSGTLDASATAPGAVGGDITITGDRIGLFGQARLDASGDAGGGRVRVGGDVMGQGALPTADAVYVAPTARLYADAWRLGDGGSVVLWSDRFTNFQGAISAKGGAQGGKGGFVETSGKIDLLAVGSVDASAPRGRAGTWLLDPTTVTISNAATSGGTLGSGVFTPNPVATANVNLTDLLNALQGGTNVTINTASAAAGDGDIILQAAINATFTSAVTLTLNAVRDVVIQSPITASGAGLNLVFNAGRDVNVTSGISTRGNLTLTGVRRVALAADIDLGTSDLTVNGPGRIGGNVVITARNAVFNDAVEAVNGASAASLRVFNSGSVTFAGGVGNVRPLIGRLAVEEEDGTTTIGGAFRTAGEVVLSNPVRLTADSTVAGSTVTFVSSIDSADATPRALQINAAGTQLGGAIGQTNRLSALRTDNAGAGDVTTLAGSVRADVVEIQDAAVINADLTITAPTSILFGSAVRSSVGTPRRLTLNSPVMTINGDVGLPANLGGPVSAFAEFITQGTGRLTWGGATLRAAIVNLSSSLLLNTDLVVDASTSATFQRDIDSTDGGNRGLTVNSPLTRFEGDAGAASDQAILGSLTTDAAGTTTILGSRLRANVVDFGDALRVDGTNVVRGVTSVTFRSTIDSTADSRSTLRVNSPLTSFRGRIGATAALNSLTTNIATGSTGDTVEIQTDRIFADVVDLPERVRLLSALVIDASTSVNLGVLESDSTPRDLTVNTASATLASIGQAAGTALGELSFNAATGAVAPGTVRLTGNVNATSLTASSAVTIDADLVETTGDQTYDGQLLLARSTTLAAPNVTFNGTINSEITDRALTVNTSAGGVTSFNAAVGTLIPLAGITTNADGRTVINTGSITTSGPQLYNDAVRLNLSTVLSGSNLTFTSTVDSADEIARSLTLNTTGGGTKTFAAAVGSINALLFITTNADGQTRVTGTAITTASRQTYNDTLLLGNDVTLTGDGLSLLGGARSEFITRSLTLNSTNSSDTILAGNIGGANASEALSALITNADGRTILRGGNVRTTGEQTYNDAVELAAATTVTGTTLRFNSTLNAAAGATASDLTVVRASPSGSVTFAAAVGALRPLRSILTDVNGSTRIGANITTAGSMTFNDAVVVYANAVLRDTGAVTAATPRPGIAFLGTLDAEGANRNLTVLTSTAQNGTLSAPLAPRIVLNGPIGATTAFGTLTLGQDRGSAATTATIAAGVSPTGAVTPNYTLRINAQNFRMGSGERLTALGSVVINATSSAVLSDISALRSITVNSPSIAIALRPTGNIITPTIPGGPLTLVRDSGVDFVAGDAITFSSAPFLTAGGNPPQFATPNGANVNVPGSFTVRSFGPLPQSLLLSGSNVFDVRAIGPSNVNIASVIAGAEPRPEPIAALAPERLLAPDVAAALAAGEGAPVGVATPEQVVALLTAEAPKAAPAGPALGAQDARAGATRSRLDPASVNRLFTTYRATMLDAQGNAQDDAIRTALDASWQTYSRAAGPRADGLGFRAYLEAVPTEAQSLVYLDGLRDIYRQVGNVGLTTAETARARAGLLARVVPATMPPAVLEAAVTAEILGTTPLTLAR